MWNTIVFDNHKAEVKKQSEIGRGEETKDERLEKKLTFIGHRIFYYKKKVGCCAMLIA